MVSPVDESPRCCHALDTGKDYTSSHVIRQRRRACQYVHSFPGALASQKQSAMSIAKGIAPDIEILQEVPEDLKARIDFKGEASLRGHLKAEGNEESGSQSYVPPDGNDDRALKEALDLLRGRI